ncbi:GNAT family N-acetyltransferase [Qipengyuania mesophila]|uniref:GNAT family N-acetyltransferase n=1 Tax=Qipengyuania mesophila TaxID=2867246 RepID=UPI0031EC0C01
MKAQSSLSAPYEVAFTIGSRRLLTVKRDVATLAFSLHDIFDGRVPAVPQLTSVEGLRILSAPVSAETRLLEVMPGFLVGARETYERSYIDMAGTYDAYMARFSGKTRSTLRRKRRKFEEAEGGTLDLRLYRTPDEIERFLQLALPLSRLTYQARLLDAGLPDDEQARAAMYRLAEADRLRAFLLFLHGEPVAYLYLPIERDTLVYAHLGYDPRHADFSPGTVLQLAALEQLFAERRFRYFDFTEGDGAHKAQFRTDSVRCASFLMLRPSVANGALLASLAAFDRVVAWTKSLAERTGADALVRRALRA